MKIKSRFKDYYDYVAHAYGGGDERIMYVREPLKDEHTIVSIANGKMDIKEPALKELLTDVKYLVVNGCVYSLVAIRDANGMCGDYKFYTKDNFDDLMGHLGRYYRWNSANARWGDYFAKESNTALELSKLIQHPVFLINRIEFDWKAKTHRFIIDKNIPILMDYGLSHYIQPEQLYQEIAYFVSNKMVTSPDLEVYDNMTDKEKIVQHGFDYKQSFRHRK